LAQKKQLIGGIFARRVPELSNREVAYMEDRIEKSIDLAAPIERVWRAVTDHQQFGEWFKVRLDGPFVVGAVSTGQITYPGYEHLKWVARVDVMDENRRFAFSWRPFNDDENIATANDCETQVEFLFTPIESGTRLVISESGFSALPDDERRLEAFRSNASGWEQQAENIRSYVES
jgi:uncharacterized protein YndB with AHSA1/START domain